MPWWLRISSASSAVQFLRATARSGPNPAEYSALAPSSPRQRPWKTPRKPPNSTIRVSRDAPAKRSPSLAAAPHPRTLRAFKKKSLLRAQPPAEKPSKRHPFPHLSLHSAHCRPPSRGKLQKSSPFPQNFPSSQVCSPQRLSTVGPPASPLQPKNFPSPPGKTVASRYFLGRVGREWRLVCLANGVLIRVDWAAKELGST